MGLLRADISRGAFELTGEFEMAEKLVLATRRT